MKVFTIFFLLFFSVNVFSQNEKEKRESYRLEIAANETQQYAMEVQESPYFVKDKILQIYCNETIFVECEVQSDSISTMKVVDKNINPEKTIVINFTQDAEDRKNIRTDLRIKNPFDKKLIYEAMMFTPISQQWKSTSIIPVEAKLENFEMWPHSIITLVLDNWKLE